MNIKKIIKKVSPLIGIIILLILIKRADISKVIFNLGAVNYRYLLPLLLFIPMAFILNTSKWCILLKKQKIRVPFAQLIKFSLIGQFYGMVTPGRLGNFVRIDYLKKYTSKSYAQSSVSVFWDRIVDLLGILMLSFLGILIFIQYLPLNFIYLVTGFLFVLLILTFFMINQRMNKRWLKVVYNKLVPNKYKGSLKSAYYSFYQEFPKCSDIFLLILLSVLHWIILMTGSYFIIRSIGINIDWFYLVSVLAIASVISLLPISISGWGTREATLFILFSPFNILLEQILAFSVLNFFLQSASLGLVGAMFAIFDK